MNTPSPDPAPALPSPSVIAANVAAALAEDVGTGDVTAALLPADRRVAARVVLREPAVVCGQAWFRETLRQVDGALAVRWLAAEGSEQPAGSTVCELSGPGQALLTAERTALNFLQLLSGVATAARALAREIAHTRARVLDTRKTLPGLRLAQKYAVRCGGAANHRVGLYDAYLIKENHIAAAGSIEEAVRAARSRRPDLPVEVEVENLEEYALALDAAPDRIMLDNFPLEALRRAVAGRRDGIELEASGGIEADGLAAIAETGVDFVSIGALTKHVRAVDYSLRVTPGPGDGSGSRR